MTDKELISELRSMAAVQEPGSASAVLRIAADRMEEYVYRLQLVRQYHPSSLLQFTERGSMEDES